MSGWVVIPFTAPLGPNVGKWFPSQTERVVRLATPFLGGRVMFTPTRDTSNPRQKRLAHRNKTGQKARTPPDRRQNGLATP